MKAEENSLDKDISEFIQNGNPQEAAAPLIRTGSSGNGGIPMIEVKDLKKAYKNLDALKGITFTVNEGDSFGFIGPNGAGKTTTIRILATLLEPSGGSAHINGISVVDDPEGVRSVIGFMPDYFGVYDGMKVWEFLDFFASSYRLPTKNRNGLISDVLEITDLTVKKDAFIEALSKGMKQRLCVAKTLLNDPKVLILDEPASGLDPRARIELKELMKELTRMKKTVFISSHILPELSDMCNKIGIIEAGNLLAFGEVDDFTSRVHDTLSIRTLRIKSLEEREKVAEAVKSYKNVKSVKEENQTVIADFHGELEDIQVFLEWLVNNKLKIVEFHEERTDLEDVFMKITKGEVS
ncbi:MAG: ABC transporter ATP-binding protein [Firmicutes bacterium]|nr:ABC transporter ATP-binding protein [Bacillota bacterium]